MTASDAPARPAVGGRGIIVGLGIAVATLGGSVAWAAAQAPGATPAGEILVVMDDFSFAPDRLTLRAGEMVTVRVENRSSSRPGKAHEIMFGRVPLREEGTLGPVQGDGFEEQLLDGATIEIVGGERVTMVMAETARLTGVDPMALMAPGMDMSAAAMRPGMDFMAVVEAGGSLTFRFQVPDRPGEWEFGCFAQDGQHYLNGMKGMLTVVPA